MSDEIRKPMDQEEYPAFPLRKSEVDLVDRIFAGLNAANGIVYMAHKAQEAEGDVLNRSTAKALNHVHKLLEDVLECFERLDRQRIAGAHSERPPYF
jgi:hypothetical protein